MQSVKWDQQYAKFKEDVGMPKKGSRMYSWKDTQLAIRPGGLNARIVKEIEDNEGGMVPYGVIGEICSKDVLQ